MKVFIDGVEYIQKPPAIEGSNYESALNLFFDFEGDEIRVVDYLRKLLLAVWEENESFSGKRPFGNSGWEFDILLPLAKAGFVDLGELDEDGNPHQWSQKQINVASAFVSDLILYALGDKPQ